MTQGVLKTALVTVLAFVVVAVAGCGLRTIEVDSAVPQAPVVSQTETATADDSAWVAAEPDSSAQPSDQDTSEQLDLKAIEGQLDAMGSELDSLEMPSDSDFDEAESAIY